MIIHGDALKILETLPNVKTIFADVPDNLGLNYNSYKDNLPWTDYYNWVEKLILKTLAKCETFWLSINLKHLLMVGELLHKHNLFPPNINHKIIFWCYTFGQYNDNDFGEGCRPIIRLSYPGTKFHCEEAIRTNSVRMLMGDKRASGLKMPSNVWDFPRTVGNSKERRSWHPTQHPEALMERIIRFSNLPTDTFVDLFLGSGTTARVCERIQYKWIGVEIDEYYCSKISEEVKVNYGQK